MVDFVQKMINFVQQQRINIRGHASCLLIVELTRLIEKYVRTMNGDEKKKVFISTIRGIYARKGVEFNADLFKEYSQNLEEVISMGFHVIKRCC